MSDIINNEAKEEKAPEAQAETPAEQPAAPAAEPAPQAVPAAPQEGARPPRTESRDRPDRRPGGGGRRGSFYESRDRGDRDAAGGEGAPRIPRFKKKICSFCQDKNLPIDYKRPDILERFVTDRGKILPRRVTGTCSKHQRVVAREIKRARIIALLPFVEQ